MRTNGRRKAVSWLARSPRAYSYSAQGDSDGDNHRHRAHPVSVARRQLRAPSGSGAAEPSYAELHADIVELYGSAFSNLLLAL
jgi:hypothetical protein